MENPLDGDILVFLPGQEDIENLKELLVNKLTFLSSDKQLKVFTLFAALPHYEQMQVFKGVEGKRKAILATNIAETSLTIPGIKYVIDSGKYKVKEYITLNGIESLKTVNISKNSAVQVIL